MRDGDHYVVNGQKTWTTLAQHADWIFCLVRNQSGREEAGGDFLPADRHEDAGHRGPADPDHRRARRSTRCSSPTCRVPVENLVGEENRGWDYAKFLLGNERSGIARIGISKQGASGGSRNWQPGILRVCADDREPAVP
ncbi:hypothetical protein [uncultured Roseibium sp.]|uniref:hypothetical protein n=1 Tax=uncultured Roseibium sp. TaxID=1936171 RepID=UPI0032173E3D